MKSFCTYFNQSLCKSCDFMRIDYPEQIRQKEELLLRELSSLGLSPLSPTITSSEKQFRNKAKFVVTGTIDHPVIGLLGEENLDQGRELLACPLHHEKINELLPHIKSFITLAALSPYQIKEKKGELKGIIIFFSEESQESYVRLVLRSKESVDRIKKYHHFLLEKSSHLKCLSVNIQPVAHAILEGEEEIFITQREHIDHPLGEFSFSLNPKAFVQTNQEVAKKLYQTAAQWMQEEGTKKFIELFCGQGAFSFFAGKAIEQGLGMELNSQAVAAANKTSKKYHLDHLSFIVADVEKIKAQVLSFSPDLILVNPPRRGLGESAKLLLELKPKRLIYSSCNYLSLSEDLKKLSEFYQIKKIQIFDMFPHTRHFETLVLLSSNADIHHDI